MIEYTVDLLDRVDKELVSWSYEVENRMRNVLQVCESTLKTIENEIKVVNMQINQINNELKEAKQAIQINKENEIRFKNMISSLQNSIKSMKQQIETLKSQKKDAEGREKNEIDKQISSITKEIEDTKKEITVLEKKIVQIHENNIKIEHIQSSLRTLLGKCKEHLFKLNERKSRLKDMYHYFQNTIFQRIKSITNGKILPKMKKTLFCGEELTRGMIDLVGESSYNEYYMMVSTDSGDCFRQISSGLKKSLGNIDTYISHCKKATSNFSYKLKDRVSNTASEVVKDTSNAVEKTTEDYFEPMIHKLNRVAELCDTYESIDLNV